MSKPLHLRRKQLTRMGGELVDNLRLDAAFPQISKCVVIDDVILVSGPEQRQEIQPRLGPAGPEDGEAVAANMGGYSVAPRMPCAGVVDGNER